MPEDAHDTPDDGPGSVAGGEIARALKQVQLVDAPEGPPAAEAVPGSQIPAGSSSDMDVDRDGDAHEAHVADFVLLEAEETDHDTSSVSTVSSMSDSSAEGDHTSPPQVAKSRIRPKLQESKKRKSEDEMEDDGEIGLRPRRVGKARR